MKLLQKKDTNICLLMLITIFTFINTSCNNVKKENTIKPSNMLIDTIKPKETVKVNKENNLYGIWIMDDMPVFEINKDSIYYIDQDRSYKYILKDSIIDIFYDDFTYKGEIHLKNSKNLIIKDSVNTNHYNKE